MFFSPSQPARASKPQRRSVVAPKMQGLSMWRALQNGCIFLQLFKKFPHIQPTMKKGLFMPVPIPIPIPHALPRLAACATVAACPHGTAGLTARRIQGESRAPSAPAGSRLLRAHLQFLVARRGGVRKATCRFSLDARSVNPFDATAPVFDSTSGGLCKPRIQGVNHD